MLEWEEKFLDLCSAGVGEAASLYYFAARSISDIGGGTINSDLKFLAVGYFLVVLYLTTTLGKMNCLHQKVTELNTFNCIFKSLQL